MPIYAEYKYCDKLNEGQFVKMSSDDRFEYGIVRKDFVNFDIYIESVKSKRAIRLIKKLTVDIRVNFGIIPNFELEVLDIDDVHFRLLIA
jgi:hypothetical protein